MTDAADIKPPRMDIWYCANCDYEVTDTRRNLAKYDYLCPRCDAVPLSRFHLRLPPADQQETRG